jgi:hypothetical protein
MAVSLRLKPSSAMEAPFFEALKQTKLSRKICVRKMRDEMAELVRFNKGNGTSGQVESEIQIN